MTSQEEQAYLEEIERVIKAGPYHADWNSLTEWSAPDWFLQKRFGIFIHWGCIVLQPMPMSGTPEICISRKKKNGSTTGRPTETTGSLAIKILFPCLQQKSLTRRVDEAVQRGWGRICVSGGRAS